MHDWDNLSGRNVYKVTGIGVQNAAHIFEGLALGGCLNHTGLTNYSISVLVAVTGKEDVYAIVGINLVEFIDDRNGIAFQLTLVVISSDVGNDTDSMDALVIQFLGILGNSFCLIKEGVAL